MQRQTDFKSKAIHKKKWKLRLMRKQFPNKQAVKKNAHLHPHSAVSLVSNRRNCFSFITGANNVNWFMCQTGMFYA